MTELDHDVVAIATRAREVAQEVAGSTHPRATQPCEPPPPR